MTLKKMTLRKRHQNQFQIKVTHQKPAKTSLFHIMQQLSTLIIITNIFWVQIRIRMISEGSYDTEDWTNGIWKFIFANKWHTNYNIITVLYANFGDIRLKSFPYDLFYFSYKNTHSFFWSDVWPSMVTHTQNVCSAFNPSKCTHTQ